MSGLSDRSLLEISISNLRKINNAYGANQYRAINKLFETLNKHIYKAKEEEPKL